MSRQSRSVVLGLLATVVVSAAVVYTVSLAGQPEVRPAQWAMVPVQSENGYAYLYNSSTGEVWMVQTDTKMLVTERRRKQPTDPE